MSAPQINPYLAENARLQQQVEDLQFTVRDLRRKLLARTSWPGNWGLVMPHERMLTVLVNAAPHVVGHDRLKIAATGRSDSGVQDGIVPVRMSGLRRALAKIVPSAEIGTMRGVGYFISIKDAARIKAAAVRDAGGAT